jgi:hypothetical protein
VVYDGPALRHSLVGFGVLAFITALAGCGERASDRVSGAGAPADAAAEAAKAKAREDIIAKREAERLAAL